MRSMTSANEHGQDKGGLDKHVYCECPACGYLSSDPCFPEGAKSCPSCGTVGDSRRLFPSERIRRIDQRIRRYHEDGEQEIVVILAATFLESLFEDLLVRIMQAEGASVRLSAAVLDAERSVGQRITKLFPILTGEQFDNAAAAAGHADFPHRWRLLRTERNAFIHDATFEDVKESFAEKNGRDALGLLDEAYAVFIHMNNRFVAKPNRRRSGRASR